MDAPHILIISGILPGTGGVGNLLIADCLKALSRDAYSFCALVPTGQRTPGHIVADADLALFRRFETAYRPFRGIVGELIGALMFSTVCRGRIWWMRRKILQWAAGRRFTSVFCILDSPSCILLARQISEALCVPLKSFVMDSSEHISSQLYHDRFTTAGLRSALDCALRHSEAIGVAGEAMKCAYEAKFGVPCWILRQGTTGPTAISRSKFASNGLLDEPYGVFRIGFSGTITAADAFCGLVSALDSIGWVLSGRKVVLRIIGARYDIHTSSPKYIEHLGWRSRGETTDLLSECDVLYLPQPFNEQQRPFAELSFPNKILNYLEAGKPILLHAPPYASLSQFCASYRVGAVCSKIENQSVIECLTDLLNSSPLQSETFADEGRRALTEVLNSQTLTENMRSLLELQL